MARPQHRKVYRPEHPIAALLPFLILLKYGLKIVHGLVVDYGLYIVYRTPFQQHGDDDRTRPVRRLVQSPSRHSKRHVPDALLEWCNTLHLLRRWCARRSFWTPSVRRGAARKQAPHPAPVCGVAALPSCTVSATCPLDRLPSLGQALHCFHDAKLSHIMVRRCSADILAILRISQLHRFIKAGRI